jgi:hypothetical protein
MTDDLVKESDGFRLGTRPKDDDVNRANWLIDRQSARIEALKAEATRLRTALNRLNNLTAKDAAIVSAALQDKANT